MVETMENMCIYIVRLCILLYVYIILIHVIYNRPVVIYIYVYKNIHSQRKDMYNCWRSNLSNTNFKNNHTHNSHNHIYIYIRAHPSGITSADQNVSLCQNKTLHTFNSNTCVQSVEVREQMAQSNNHHAQHFRL